MKKYVEAYLPLIIGLLLQIAVLALILMGDPQTLATHSNPINSSTTEVLSQTLQTASTFGMNK
ncbi:hypothetical protein [Neisseria wadsworthii]|uniref:Uncharacterized protein n=1 Tax=Neisseria wadsworthii 9715 TaxID=1030841 RepID=G4CPS5_9NEIS|nr:hypothetical protein [Neisseria wadsworthii]EGZ47432.1 hypothetical protein HMPREF9370_1085 [Neisseria wadsworthii 9715]QMT34876.1 hypothetical protein H3L96_07255 [Neisseria wadsworthii]